MPRGVAAAAKTMAFGEAMPGAGTFNFADLWEATAASVPTRTALLSGDQRRTYKELDERADGLARWMMGRGVGVGDFVGVQLTNTVEHVESVLATFKLRAVPVNVNPRYVSAELAPLLADSRAVGVVHDASKRADIAAASTTGTLRWTLETGPDYERALTARGSVPRDRSSDDLYAIYTGGTTGAPKAVVWRMEDAFYACLGGGDPTTLLGVIDRPADLTSRIVETEVFLAAPPLAHASGMWPTLRWLLAGGTVVLHRNFDAREVWRAVAEHQVTIVNIVADAMARPLLDALVDVDIDSLRSLRVIASGGGPLSPVYKEELRRALPGVTVRDLYGSSETGVQGTSVDVHDGAAVHFRPTETVVLDPHTLSECAPGETGVIARYGHVPLRYHNDPERSETTFRTLGGRRLALTGDLGSIDESGLVVHGRGAACINTGGEKVYPSEVEATLKSHSAVADAMVIGEADERWGQRVVALVKVSPGSGLTLEELRAHCSETLSGYKIPRKLVRVDEIARTPAGKLDHQWARRMLSRSEPAARA